MTDITETIHTAVIDALRVSQGDETLLGDVVFELAAMLGYVTAICTEGRSDGIVLMLDLSREASEKAADQVAPALRLLAAIPPGHC